MRVKDVLLLDYFNGKPVHAKVPDYKKSIYGDNANIRVDFLYTGGWIRYSKPSETVHLLPDQALAQFLRHYHLSADGTHADLVRRIIDNIPEEKYSHVVPKIYLLTPKGRTEIAHYMAYVLNVRQNYGLTEGEIGDAQRALELREDSFTARDILYYAFQRKISIYEMAGEWAKLRNLYYILASFFLRGKEIKKALDYLYLVFLMDMSGMGNKNKIIPYDELFPTQKGIIVMMNEARRSLTLSDDAVHSSFLSTVARMAPKLPFSYFSPTVMADQLIDRLNGHDFNGEFWKSKSQQPGAQRTTYSGLPLRDISRGEADRIEIVKPHFGPSFTLKPQKIGAPKPFLPEEEKREEPKKKPPVLPREEIQENNKGTLFHKLKKLF